MAMSGIKSLGHSTLPNRMARLQMIKALWSPEEDAALQRAVIAVESAYKFHKWTFVKNVMEEDGFGPSSRADGRVFDGEAMRRRWEAIMELGTSRGTSMVDDEEVDLSMRTKRSTSRMSTDSMLDGNATEDDEEYLNSTKDELLSDRVAAPHTNGSQNHTDFDIAQTSSNGGRSISGSVTGSTSQSWGRVGSVMDGNMDGIERGGVSGVEYRADDEHRAAEGAEKEHDGTRGNHGMVNGVDKAREHVDGAEQGKLNDAAHGLTQLAHGHAAVEDGDAMEL